MDKSEEASLNLERSTYTTAEELEVAWNNALASAKQVRDRIDLSEERSARLDEGEQLQKKLHEILRQHLPGMSTGAFINVYCTLVAYLHTCSLRAEHKVLFLAMHQAIIPAMQFLTQITGTLQELEGVIAPESTTKPN